MQSIPSTPSAPAARRMLSSLAARIHPQLPLSPRESQQLLHLLTTSFRAHLDREHPLPGPASPPPPAASSHASTTRHLNAILTNPLLAVKPRPRDPTSTTAGMLQDPVAWFVNEIASGTATLSKAALCLQMLPSPIPDTPRTRYAGKLPAAVLAEWLRTSQLDTSRGFVSGLRGYSAFIPKLVSLFVAEGEMDTLWRWFIRSTEQRVIETGLSAATVGVFRQKLLSNMVSIQAASSLKQGIATFLQACRITETVDRDASRRALKAANGLLVMLITNAKSSGDVDPELYNAFARLTTQFGPWQPVVDSMLSLYHPTQPSATTALRYLNDPATAVGLDSLSQDRRKFIVQLCLGVAHLTMHHERYADAQFAMEFAKQHFADLVLSETQDRPRRDKKEQQQLQQQKADYRTKLEQHEQSNLELLNALALP